MGGGGLAGVGGGGGHGAWMRAKGKKKRTATARAWRARAKLGGVCVDGGGAEQAGRARAPGACADCFFWSEQKHETKTTTTLSRVLDLRGARGARSPWPSATRLCFSSVTVIAASLRLAPPRFEKKSATNPHTMRHATLLLTTRHPATLWLRLTRQATSGASPPDWTPAAVPPPTDAAALAAAYGDSPALVGADGTVVT